MAGISSKALEFGNPENKYKFNGIEKENDLQIDVYDAQLRELDGQTGRWWQIDPKTEDMEMWSPYASNYDNPLRYSDPLGDEGEDCCRGLIDGIVQLGKDAVTFTVGALNAFTTNQVGGSGRGDPSSFGNSRDAAIAQAGQTFGDLLTIGGTVGVSGASVVVEGGTVGFASPLVVPVLIQQWGVATPTAVKNIVNDFSDRVNSSSNSSGNNPYGSKGKPDHQQKVNELEKKAQQEAKPGESVIKERKIQGQNSNRKPDVQIVDPTGKARKVFEAERKPTSTRNIKREGEYRKLKIEQETHPVGKIKI